MDKGEDLLHLSGRDKPTVSRASRRGPVHTPGTWGNGALYQLKSVSAQEKRGGIEGGLSKATTLPGKVSRKDKNQLKTSDHRGRYHKDQATPDRQARASL